MGHVFSSHSESSFAFSETSSADDSCCNPNDENMFNDEEGDGFFTIAKLKDGSSFGEMALINNKLRMATVRCLKNSTFMIISKESYI
jgi:hypothetical protein